MTVAKRVLWHLFDFSVTYARLVTVVCGVFALVAGVNHWEDPAITHDRGTIYYGSLLVWSVVGAWLREAIETRRLRVQIERTNNEKTTAFSVVGTME